MTVRGNRVKRMVEIKLNWLGAIPDVSEVDVRGMFDRISKSRSWWQFRLSMPSELQRELELVR